MNSTHVQRTATFVTRDGSRRATRTTSSSTAAHNYKVARYLSESEHEESFHDLRHTQRAHKSSSSAGPQRHGGSSAGRDVAGAGTWAGQARVSSYSEELEL